ncbi:MAG: DUF4389 domain-containing protein [Jatrophihabitans sp.]|uniref:DUF4389 domain-containing protein n=1 Tax=Jatrophihabitans sp. TaxID=1932789 RepID=UPI003F810FE2
MATALPPMPHRYPVQVEAALDKPLSRWLWLVKWVLAIPHYLTLVALWLAFVVTSIGAFVSILVTGRYPRSLFEFNVGVLRWSWRVAYYTYGALGTDRYPPFTLADVPDYPAHLSIEYPQHLSRGLVLVKWWLLALPHYLIVGLFTSGAWFVVSNADARFSGGGLIGLLVLVAAVSLLFTGRYPLALFDFVIGLNRWVLRVAAYAALMTDDYPPFRLDLGGHEPGGTLTMPRPPSPVPPSTGQGMAPAPGRPGWTAGRVVAAVAGSLLMLLSFGLLAGGAVALGVDRFGRDGGYVTSSTATFATTHAVITSSDLSVDSPALTPTGVLGTVRIRVTPTDSRVPVFIGIAPTDAANRWLAGAARTRYSDLAGDRTAHDAAGGAPPAAPARSGIFVASSTGTGRRVVTWPVESGHWTVVVLRADGRAGLGVRADVGATLPSLPWIGGTLLVVGAVLFGGGLSLIVVPAHRAGRHPDDAALTSASAAGPSVSSDAVPGDASSE